MKNPLMYTPEQDNQSSTCELCVNTAKRYGISFKRVMSMTAKQFAKAIEKYERDQLMKNGDNIIYFDPKKKISGPKK